jgi:hypothetical protein
MASDIQENEAERGQGHFRGFGISHLNGHSQYCLPDIEAHRLETCIFLWLSTCIILRTKLPNQTKTKCLLYWQCMFHYGAHCDESSQAYWAYSGLWSGVRGFVNDSRVFEADRRSSTQQPLAARKIWFHLIQVKTVDYIMYVFGIIISALYLYLHMQKEAYIQ